ncbi:MAG: glycosyltransferase [Phycisphaerae bacterium]|jgi:glycosyltransferase involved in cell wall biosynthesis|nr:glycosyltransferase [Phycisphaerae bacterium]
MARVLHIVAADTSPDMLAQARLLAGDGDRIVSAGPAAAVTAPAGDVTPIHGPLGIARLSGLAMRELAAGADVIHTWSPAAASAAQQATKKTVRAVLISLGHLPPPAELDGLLSGLFDRRWAITVPTESDRHRLALIGAPADRLFVLPPATEPIHAAPQRRQHVRKALQLRQADFLLVAPSQMTRHAGHKYVAWAHAMARIFLPQVRLAFPTRGPAEQSVRTFVKTTGYDREVFFTWRRFALPDVLAAADAALFLHRRNCGGAALAAAMAAGLAAVAWDCTDLADCAPHDQAALLSPRGNVRAATGHVVRLADEADLRRRLASNAAARARERFSLPGVRRQLVRIYSDLAPCRS